MGYLVCGQLVAGTVDPARLDGLAESVGYRLWTWGPLTFVELLEKGIQPEAPLTIALRSKGRAPSLSAMPPVLAQALELLDRQEAYQGPDGREELAQALDLAERLGTRVLGFAEDDDSLEVSCVCSPGRVERARIIRADLDMEFDDGVLKVTPRPFEEDDVLQEDRRAAVAALRGQDGIQVEAPRPEGARRLHGLVLAEVKLFSGQDGEELGIGSWDGIRSDALRLIAERYPRVGVMDARVDAAGWTRCPNCGRKFKPTDPNAVEDGRHRRCGQVLRFVR